MSLVNRATRLLERARWKKEGWDRPEPPEILEGWANESGFHGVHLSKVGPNTTHDADGFKVGINPDSDYEPVGLYVHPLNPNTYREWFSGRTSKNPIGGEQTQKRAPYGGTRTWMYVLESTASRPVRVSVSGETSYPDREARKALRAIVRDHPDMVEETLSSTWVGMDMPDEEIEAAKALTREDVQDIPQHKNYNRDDPFLLVWMAIGAVATVAGNGGSTWNRWVDKYADVDLVIDEGFGALHQAERRQATFLTPSAYETVDVVPNVWDWRRGEEGKLGGIDYTGQVR